MLWNCEKNEITEASTKSIVTHISFKEFIQTTGIKENSSLLKVSKNTKEKLTLLKEDIVKIDRENYSSYTFKVLTNTPNSHFFYNYVVLINTQGIILSSNLFEYQPSKKWLLNTQKPFTGKVKLITGVDSNLLSRGGLCVTGVRSFWLCSFNNTGPQHAPGQCNASSTEYIVEYEIGPCSAEGDGNGAAEVSDSSSGPGGGGSSGGGSTIPVDTSISLPTIPPDENGKCPEGYVIDPTTGNCVVEDIIDNTNNPCVSGIINRLKEKDTNGALVPDLEGKQHLSQMVLDLFGECTNYDLTINVAQLGTNSQGFIKNAETNGIDSITLDTDLINEATQLSIAKTLIHESLHSFINLKTSIYDRNYDLTKALNEYYKLYSKDYPNDVAYNLTQHNFMAEFVEALAHSLSTYDNHRQSIDYYTAMSWGGLESSEVYQALSNTKKTAIQNIINNERYAKSDAKSTKCP